MQHIGPTSYAVLPSAAVLLVAFTNISLLGMLVHTQSLPSAPQSPQPSHRMLIWRSLSRVVWCHHPPQWGAALQHHRHRRMGHRCRPRRSPGVRSTLDANRTELWVGNTTCTQGRAEPAGVSPTHQSDRRAVAGDTPVGVHGGCCSAGAGIQAAWWGVGCEDKGMLYPIEGWLWVTRRCVGRRV